MLSRQVALVLAGLTTALRPALRAAGRGVPHRFQLCAAPLAGLGIACWFCAGAAPARGDVVYYGNREGQVMKLDTATGTPAVFANTTASGVTIGANGYLYAADQGTASISKIAPNGSVTAFATGLNGLSFEGTLAFNSGGNLFASSSTRIAEYDGNGNGNLFGPALTSPASYDGLAFDASGYLYASVNSGNEFDNSDGYILKIATNGSATTFASGLDNPQSLAFDKNGNLYVVDMNGWNANGTIVEIDQNGNKTTLVASTPNGPSLGFDSAGNLLALCSCGWNGSGNGPGLIEGIDAGGNQHVLASGLIDDNPINGSFAIQTPEPAALALLALGAAGLLIRRRRLAE